MSNEAILSILNTINQKLTRIENYLKEHHTKTSLGSYNDYLPDSDDEPYKTEYIPLISAHANNSDSDSDSDCEMLVDEIYDSDDGEYPIERPEVYPEPKLSLTPLQIELVNEEFMRYRNKISDESDHDDDNDDNDDENI
jgi:hypothetical protein